jgi:hypothetical protein
VPRHLDRQAHGTQDVDAVLVGGHDRDRGGLVELGDVVHAVGLGPVAAHVVDDPAGGDHQPVARLLDALHVADQPGVRRVDLDDPPRPPEVRRAVDQWLVAPGQHRRRHLRPVAPGRRVGDGDVRNCHHA